MKKDDEKKELDRPSVTLIEQKHNFVWHVTQTILQKSQIK